MFFFCRINLHKPTSYFVRNLCVPARSLGKTSPGLPFSTFHPYSLGDPVPTVASDYLPDSSATSCSHLVLQPFLPKVWGAVLCCVVLCFLLTVTIKNGYESYHSLSVCPNPSDRRPMTSLINKPYGSALWLFFQQFLKYPTHPVWCQQPCHYQRHQDHPPHSDDVWCLLEHWNRSF